MSDFLDWFPGVTREQVDAVLEHTSRSSNRFASHHRGMVALQNGFDQTVLMQLRIDIEQESDGRWLAEVDTLPGVLTYGVTRTDAVAKVQALALRVLAERLEQGEAVPELLSVSFQAA